MNSFAALGLAYFLFTLISSGVLITAFRARLDPSARYLLFSELCMVISCGVIFLVNVNAAPINAITIGIPNFAVLVSEAAIFYSTLSITKKMDKKWLVLTVTLLGTLTIIAEMYRNESNYRWIILANTIILTSLFIANYWAYKNVLLPKFPNNQFVQFLKWLAFGLICFGLIRVIANFSSAPIIPRGEPTIMAIIAFTLFMILGSFRYITYIGFRITWVDQINPTENILNQPLVKAIEEKNQFLRGLITSNRFIGISALASSLAHQLSQPLTTIAIRAETVRRDLLPSDDNTRAITSLDEICMQSNQLSGLVQNLRQLFRSKIEKFESINLQKVCNEVLEIIKPTLQSKKITLLKQYESNPIVFGDGVQLQQVLINLFNNAIDAINESNSDNREILITITNNESYASLSVADSGLGINPIIFESLFELYKTTKPSGLGVGLWLSKTIIERHQGKITASNHVRGGACFEIQIPLNETARVK
jgi:signal transduction histidine kinase